MSPAINQAMREALLTLIRRERSGETIDRSLLKACSRMLMQLGSNDDPWAIYHAVRVSDARVFTPSLAVSGFWLIAARNIEPWWSIPSTSGGVLP